MNTTLKFMLILATIAISACAQERKADEPKPLATLEAAREQLWTTDYKAAAEKAKAENKHLLLDFTGSDWCGWCKKLDAEVFSTKEFQDYGKEKFVLVQLDYPRRKAQSDAEKAQNRQLQERFKIEGFPTIVILDPDGREIARTGYLKGGGEAYVLHLQDLLRKAEKK